MTSAKKGVGSACGSDFNAIYGDEMVNRREFLKSAAAGGVAVAGGRAFAADNVKKPPSAEMLKNLLSGVENA